MKRNIFKTLLLLIILSSYNTSFSQCAANIQYLGSGNITEISQWTEIRIYDNGCGNLANNDYLVDVYKVDWDHVIYNGYVSIKYDQCNGVGWYLDPGQVNQCPWAEYNRTNGHFTTYVYYVHETWDGLWIQKWLPCPPSDAYVAYYTCHDVSTPTIGTGGMPFNRVINGIPYYTLYNNWSTHLTGYSSYADCWSWHFATCDNSSFFCPPWSYGGVTLGDNGSQTLAISNFGYNNDPCPQDNNQTVTGFNLVCYLRAQNGSGYCSYGQSSEIGIAPSTDGPPQGCPWLFTITDSGAIPENNALYMSEFSENYGNDMKDLYVLDNEPAYDSNNTMTFDLTEPSSDYTLLDQVQMFAIDHPAGSEIGVTQSGDIVMYDTSNVNSSDGATLNGSTNITPYIQYEYEGNKIVRGPSSDSIYAHYDTTAENKRLKLTKSTKRKLNRLDDIDSLALVGKIGRDPTYDYPIGNINKEWAGSIGINTNDAVISKQFARRENIHQEIIPFGDIDQSVNSIDVKFAENYEVGYLSVVPIHYFGYTQTSLQMISAIHSTLGDVSTYIQSKDSVYTYIDSTCTITLQFQDATDPAEGYVRDYVIQMNGHYTVPGNNQIPVKKHILGEQKSQNLKPFEFSLFNNYPNPFNPVTSIKYSIPKDGDVSLKIYNMLGQLVETLVNNSQKAGEYEANFNGENYASGIYIYKLEFRQTGSSDIQNVTSKKMVLIK